jgi:hypothetical protein
VNVYLPGGTPIVPAEPTDLFRPLRRADCDAIARHYNRNLLEPDPIWCANGTEADGKRIWMHRLVLAVRGRGRAIGQVHERDGRVISYFGGYTRGELAVFSIGVVDLDTPDPMEVWRRDVAHLFCALLESGAETFRIRSSSDQGRFVGWMEREVGMERVEGANAWIADRAVIARYVGAYLPVARPAPPLLATALLAEQV